MSSLFRFSCRETWTTQQQPAELNSCESFLAELPGFQFAFESFLGELPGAQPACEGSTSWAYLDELTHEKRYIALQPISTAHSFRASDSKSRRPAPAGNSWYYSAVVAVAVDRCCCSPQFDCVDAQRILEAAHPFPGIHPEGK